MANLPAPGQGNTFNLPNFHGELFQISPSETPFLSAIGGLNGAKAARAKTFEWQTVDLRTSSANNVAVEGAAAPAGTGRVRSAVHNICEIHHSAIELTYSRLAATSQYAGINVGSQWDDQVQDELALQTRYELSSMAIDIEQSFLNGVYADDTSAGVTRKTQGILGAAGLVKTVAPASPGNALTIAMLNGHFKSMYDAGAPLNSANTVLMGNSSQVLALSTLYAGATNQLAPERDRTIGGVNVKTVVTPFGEFGVMLNRWMPAGTLAVIDLSVCYPVFLEIPQKGLLFVEELARVGSSRKFQLYGEIGLEYGAPTYHGVITGLA